MYNMAAINVSVGNGHVIRSNKHLQWKIDDLDDDVFMDNLDFATTGPENLLPISIKVEQSEQNISLNRDAYCQTDFPYESDVEENDDAVAVESYMPNMQTKITHGFCWRHNACLPMARPSSPVSYPASCEVKVQHLLLHNRCSVCKAEEETRLSLKSRKESTVFKKIPVEPSLATIKHCPTNLLAETIPNCSNLWTENRTFYLGIDANTKIEKSRGILRTRPQSVPSLMPSPNSSYCQTGKKARSKSLCMSNSFCIRGLCVNDLGLSCKECNKRNGLKRDWLLVQRVIKKIPADSNTDQITEKPYYCEVGLQEMVFCISELRTISYIETICCEHFLSMSREDALKQKRTVELLFSSQGPVLRDDKHLKGRSVFFFCCHEEKTRTKLRKGPSNSELPTIPSSLLFSGKSKSKNQKASIARSYNRHRSSSRKSDCAASLPNLLADANEYHDNSASLLETNEQDKLAESVFVPLQNGDNLPSHSLASDNNAYALLSAVGSASANPEISGIATQQKKRRGISVKRTKKEMTGRSKTNNGHKVKKTVRFSDDSFEKNIQNSQHIARNELKFEENKDVSRRASLPPPPKLKMLKDDSDDDDLPFPRRRRGSVALCFTDVKVTKPKKKPLNAIQESPQVSVYQPKHWKSIRIVVSFKDQKLINEFYEYKNLQDLYTWLRQELLKMELLTPGAELLLSNDNLKFPLKANTATNMISSLPSTSFLCEELIKVNSNSEGLGESDSKYDTRFAIPLDMKKLDGLTPVQYLHRFCIVSVTSKAFYLSIFSSHDKFRRKSLSFKELTAAMERLFVELAQPLLKKVIDLMGLDSIAQKNRKQNEESEGVIDQHEHWKTNFSLSPSTFVSLCALANRILCREDEIDGISVKTIKQTGTQLEDADFYNIEGKLREHELNPLTKRLLLYVRNKHT